MAGPRPAAINDFRIEAVGGQQDSRGRGLVLKDVEDLGRTLVHETGRVHVGQHGPGGFGHETLAEDGDWGQMSMPGYVACDSRLTRRSSRPINRTRGHRMMR